MKIPLRFAVIGCGRMGRRRMKLAVSHESTSLACVSDISEQEGVSAAGDFGVPFVHDWEETIERSDVDAVFVSVPNAFHAAPVVRALELGKHVFCEKPLAATVEQAEQIARASDASTAMLKVGSNARFFPNVLKAKELLDAGAIGSPFFMRGWIGNNGWQLGDTWYANAAVAGAGTFLDNGSHILDIGRWFMGEVVECIGTVQQALWPVGSLEDNGFGIFTTESDGRIFLQASWTEWAGYLYLEVYGPEGFLRIDSRGDTCACILGTRAGDQTVFDYSTLPPTSYQTEFDRFLEDVAAAREPAPSALDGLMAVRMAFAVHESARTGRAVHLEPRAALKTGVE